VLGIGHLESGHGPKHARWYVVVALSFSRRYRGDAHRDTYTSRPRTCSIGRGSQSWCTSVGRPCVSLVPCGICCCLTWRHRRLRSSEWLAGSLSRYRCCTTTDTDHNHNLNLPVQYLPTTTKTTTTTTYSRGPPLPPDPAIRHRFFPCAIDISHHKASSSFIASIARCAAHLSRSLTRSPDPYHGIHSPIRRSDSLHHPTMAVVDSLRALRV